MMKRPKKNIAVEVVLSIIHYIKPLKNEKFKRI
jgi:hypothetical protein